MPMIKTSGVKYPDGWELVEPNLLELQAKMREAENDSRDGKDICARHCGPSSRSITRGADTCMIFTTIGRTLQELYEFCLDQGHADRSLIAKWKNPGYERLCCLHCIQARDHNFATTCVCRQWRIQENFLEGLKYLQLDLSPFYIIHP